MVSVMSQTSKEFEYIVVDGSPPKSPISTQPDGKAGSLKAEQGGTSDRAIIKSMLDNAVDTFDGYSTCVWINGVSGGFYSEPDKGIYNAMNKGILKAKGEYLHFLNSGDWLVDERVVEDMLHALSSPPLGELEGADIFVGNVIQIRPDGKKRYTKHLEKNVSLMTFYRGTLQHTSAYIKRSLFDKYGLYDETLKIVSDWKWYLLVAGLNNANVKFTDRYVTYFDMTGISSTNLELDKAERRQVLEELVSESILADYDNYTFEIEQIKRLKRYPIIYKMIWFVERVLFKKDKRRRKRGWK